MRERQIDYACYISINPITGTGINNTLVGLNKWRVVASISFQVKDTDTPPDTTCIPPIIHTNQ